MKGNDIICETRNSATLMGNFFTVHVAQVRPESLLSPVRDTWLLSLLAAAARKAIYWPCSGEKMSPCSDRAEISSLMPKLLKPAHVSVMLGMVATPIG